MIPSHTHTIPDDRVALAPYSFVPLPERVVRAEEGFGEVRGAQDRYHEERFTGRILCRLTTDSPLFVRCGLTPEQLKEGLEAKDRPDFFFTESPDMPVIPGSSLRGMLRALVELAAYGKIDRVGDRERFFFRAVAAPQDDPLAQPYKDRIGSFGRNVRVGYLEREAGRWYVRPARRIGRDAFIKVKEWDKKTRRELIPRSLVFTRLNEPDYQPQYVECSFITRSGQRGAMIDQIGPPGSIKGGVEGWLVTSGNMVETGDMQQGARSPRSSHVVVAKETERERLPIDPDAVEDYRASLTGFQKEPPFDEQWGALVVGRPIFFCEPGRGEPITAFGHSPNFRLPYRFPGSVRAASPRDFVPAALRDEQMVDLAEAIFGFVRGSRQANQEEQAVAGRVFVGDATPEPGQAELWLSERPFTPHILGSPKLTTFQHYLVQPSARKRELLHYGSRPGEETTIRGHKLYWHKGPQPPLAMPPEQLQKANETQLTTMRPVRPGVRFAFALHVENLSPVELGALLWVLQLGGDAAYRLKLGMGKPLGMGAVRLEHELFESQRPERYARLFDDAGWATGEAPVPPAVVAAAIADFEAYVLSESGEGERGYTALSDTLRMRCLLALLIWPGPLPETTRYLEIERPAREGVIRAAKAKPGETTVNEYKERPVLPLPTLVAGLAWRETDLAVYERATQQPARPIEPVPTPAVVEAKPTSPARELPPAPPAKAVPKIPTVGELFTGKISQMDASAAMIDVPGFRVEQAIGLLSADVADLRRFKVGNAARVEVVEQKVQRSGRVLLIVRPAPPKPKDGQG